MLRPTSFLMRLPRAMTMYRPVIAMKIVIQYIRWSAPANTLAFLACAAREKIEDLQHDACHCHQHPDLDPEDAAVLPVHRVMGEDEIIEVVAAREQPDDADAGEDQHPERNHRL